MSNTSTYVAFASSEKLYTNTDNFINEMRNGATKPNPKLITDIMVDFTAEGIHAFFITPTDMIGLKGAPRKIVEVTANTITKTNAAVIKQTAKKLDLKQNQQSAEYMDTMRMNKEGTWFVAFPLEDEFAARIRSAIQKARDESPSAAMPELTRNLHQLTDVALSYYFEQPIEIMRFGPILSKITSVGLATIGKATRATIDRVFTKFDDEQVLASCEYMESLLLEGPRQ